MTALRTIVLAKFMQVNIVSCLSRIWTLKPICVRIKKYDFIKHSSLV